MRFCIADVSKVYCSRGVETTALAHVSGWLKPGEFVALVGPSGCGKSTLLRLAAGLEVPTAGSLYWQGGSVYKTAMVFQEVGLFPWLTVAENIAFGLMGKEISAQERHNRVAQRMDIMGLTEFANAYPHMLSGGMKQRVGIARALVTEPDLLLMDEPFSALDAQTRWLLEEELVRYWEACRPATLYVTHHIMEALRLADRIWVFSQRPGRIVGEYEVKIPRQARREVQATAELSRMERVIWQQIRADVEASFQECRRKDGAK